MMIIPLKMMIIPLKMMGFVTGTRTASGNLQPAPSFSNSTFKALFIYK